jgi:hypothetical protein
MVLLEVQRGLPSAFRATRTATLTSSKEAHSAVRPPGADPLMHELDCHKGVGGGGYVPSAAVAVGSRRELGGRRWRPC